MSEFAVYNYCVKILFPGKKRWRFLGSGGSTSSVRIYALTFTKEEAKKAADKINRDNPDVRAEVRQFCKAEDA